MAVKPANLVYGVDDKPPLWTGWMLGFQHLSIIAIALLFPVLISREIGGGPDQAASLVSMSMLAGGIGVILQGLQRGPVGSGYLCPQVCGPSYLTASILAAKSGGLPLLFGMTAVAGATESLLSRIMHRVRFLFPAEVTGLIVAMVGITVIRLAMTNFLGMGQEDIVTTAEEITVSFVTLGMMLCLNVWSAGKLRLFCILIGMATGYLVSWGLGVLQDEQIGHLGGAALVYWPFSGHPGWSFDVRLLIPIMVATMCSTLKTVGDLTTCQKINDEEWQRPDMANMKKGILADGLGCLTAGLLGGMGQSSSSTNIGLSMATGATSRAIAIPTGILLMVFAFCPKLTALFVIMPKPVIGATLIFALSFMIVAGLQIIMSRMLDARKTFVVGISAIFGLSVDVVPHAYTGLHHWIQPIFSSSLSTAAVCAVVLNLLFRIGIAQKSRLVFDPGTESVRRIHDFLDHWGRAWGARGDVIARATGALTELAETVASQGLTRDKIFIEVSFQELKLSITATYRGLPMEFPERPPSPEEVIADDRAQAALSGFLVRRYVDRIKVSDSDGECSVRFDFDH